MLTGIDIDCRLIQIDVHIDIYDIDIDAANDKDIDTDDYSFEFDQPAPASTNLVSTVLNTTPGYRDEKPEKCDVVPQSACAVAYDSGSCDGTTIQLRLPLQI